MPGITAILMSEYDNLIAQNITEMTESMRHEDFYGTDIHNEGTLPFVASRMHLNILNKEPQPIYNEERSLLVMMDGELYVPEGLTERMRCAGHDIKTDSDAELLLHLYEEQGEDFVHDLNGRFIALIYDIRQRKTVIINDCFGMYRAYYAQHNGTFIIASEVKSLLKYRPLSCSVNKEKFYEYFLYDAILNDETFFKEIHRLPPASIWTYKHGEVSRRQYFDLSTLRKDTSLNKEQFSHEFVQLFRKILPKYVSDKNIGISLTGGWDSRAILATMNHLGYSAPCYTWCGPYRDSLDVKLAREIAGSLNQKFQVCYLGKDFFENFSEYARRTIYISDGCADIFKSHEIYFNSMARNIAPVRLTGSYGTEIIARNPYFMSQARIDKRIFSGQFLLERQELSHYGHSFEFRDSFIDGLRWLFPSGFLALENSQVGVRWPYMDKEVVKFIFSAPQEFLQDSKIQRYVVEKNSDQLSAVPSDKGAYIKLDNMLRNERLRLSALWCKSLTILDKTYLSHSVPHVFTRMDPLMKQLRLERIVLGHSNLVAYRRWMKNELTGFTKKMLSEEQTLSRPYLNQGFITKIVSDHFNNRANYIAEIGKILSLEIWHRLFID